MATAELALAIPALVLVVMLSIQSLSLGLAQVRCTDAARAGARAAARGEDAHEVRRAAQQVAPARSQVSVSRSRGTVRVTVSSPSPASWVGLTPRAEAVAAVEP